MTAEDEVAEVVNAVELLTAKGYGVVSPNGLWWNANIAKSDPGGMVSQHEIKAPE